MLGLGVMLLQGLPLNMPAATNGTRWAADWLGIGHPPWNMYAPVPDRQNNRLAAEIMNDEDQVIAHWSAPEWEKLSAGRRFSLHRWSEYYDHVWTIDNAHCWPALAQHINNRALKPDQAANGSARQVRLIMQQQLLAPPAGNRWPPPVPPEGYDERWVLSNEPLP